MLELIEEMTQIYFYPKDENLGIPRMVIKEIAKKCNKYKYKTNIDDDEYTFYICNVRKVASNEEIKELVKIIKESCKGIDLNFKIQTYTFRDSYKDISLEDLGL